MSCGGQSVPSGRHEYSYDALSSLTSANHPGTQADETYSYDALRNRVGPEYDAANRITENAGVSYEHDQSGRLSRRTDQNNQSTHFEWDSEGRLTEVTAPNGESTTYKYDAFGRRIEKSGSGGTKRYAYGISNDALGVFNGSNTLESRFTFMPGVDFPLAMERNGQRHFFQQDALSTVTSLSNSAGSIVERYEYGAFGQPLSSSSVGNPYTFTGREWDQESSTYYYRARQYDPSIGRFISEDPVAAINAYVYGGNNPRQMMDPSGQYTTAEQTATMSIGQGLIDSVAVGIGLAFLQQSLAGTRNASGHAVAFHYTFSGLRASILATGISKPPDDYVYVTPNGEYSPEEAEQLLALRPDARGYRTAVIGVNLHSYAATTGHPVPPPTVVRERPEWERAGGGLEIRLTSAVPPTSLFSYR